MHLCMKLSEKTKLENYFPSKTASKFTHFEMAEWTKLCLKSGFTVQIQTNTLWHFHINSGFFQHYVG